MDVPVFEKMCPLLRALSPLGFCLPSSDHRGHSSLGNWPPALSHQAPSLISRFWDPKINALIWLLQLSGFSSRSLGSNQEGGSSKEGGNQNKVKSMASQLLAKFEESSRNPSLLKQVSPIRCSLDLPSWWPELRSQKKKCSGWWWISGIPARLGSSESSSRSWVSRLF